MTETKQELLDMVNGWIKNKELYKHRKLIEGSVYMIDNNQYDQPNQESLAKELAYKKVGFWSCEMDEVKKVEKKALRLAEKYYEKMDNPINAIDFLIKHKLGKNLDELIENGCMRLDPEDVAHDIMEKKQ